jgi:hypothetical protein
MIRVFDFQCRKCHKISEHFVSDDIREHNCPCGHVADRLVAAPRAQLEGFTGDFPGASMAWVKRREERMKQERVHEERHGTTWIGQTDSYRPKNPE